MHIGIKKNKNIVLLFLLTFLITNCDKKSNNEYNCYYFKFLNDGGDFNALIPKKYTIINIRLDSLNHINTYEFENKQFQRDSFNWPIIYDTINGYHSHFSIASGNFYSSKLGDSISLESMKSNGMIMDTVLIYGKFNMFLYKISKLNSCQSVISAYLNYRDKKTSIIIQCGSIVPTNSIKGEVLSIKKIINSIKKI